MSRASARPHLSSPARRTVAGLAAGAVAVVGALLPVAASAAEETGSISGTVTVPAGISATTVSVSVSSTDWTKPGGWTTVGADGTFSVTGLDAGTYKVQFGDDDGPLIEEYWDDAADWSEADTVTVTAGGNRSGVNATLVKGGSISGTVTLPAGASDSVTDVLVRASIDGSWFSSYVHPGADGNYTINGLPAGRYVVSFTPTSQSDLVAEQWQDAVVDEPATYVTVALGQAVGDIDAALETGGTISGTVTVPDGFALGSVFVQVLSAGGISVGQSTMAADGSYVVRGLAPGSYIVLFSATGLIPVYWPDAGASSGATPVVVEGTQTREDIDATLVEGATIHGTVTAPAGVDRSLISVQATPHGAAVGYRWESVAADGTYAITGLPAGTYVLRFSSSTENVVDEYWNDKPTYATADTITVALGQRFQADAALQAGGTISGTLTVPASVDPQMIQVSASSATGTGSSRSGRVDDTGHYVISGLATGSYTVYFWAGSTGAISEYYDDADTFMDATPVSVTVGQETPGINAQLALGGSISGTVSVPDGFPVTSIYVNASSQSGGMGGGASVASDGSYTVRGLADGPYTVWFSASTSGLISEYWDDAETLAEASPVTISGANQLTGIDATLVEGGTISGTVSAPSGFDVTQTYVQVSTTEGYPVGSTWQIAPDGSYAVRGLPAGDFVVSATSMEPGLPAKYWPDTYHRTDATPVSVSLATETPDIDLSLEEGATISGTVTVPATFDPAQVYVNASAEDTYGWAEVNPDGSYEMVGLAPGSYRILFSAGERELKDQYWDHVDRAGSATRVVVGEGSDTTGVDAGLAVGGSITGTATVPSGYDGYCVTVDGDGIEQDFDYQCFDAGESYELMGLPTGEHVIQAYAYRGDDVSTVTRYYPNADRPSTATPVPVTAGATTTGRNFNLSSATPLGDHVAEFAYTFSPARPVPGTQTQITITATGDADTPTGAVLLWGDARYLGDAVLTNGVATITADLTGEDWIYLDYSGDADYYSTWDGTAVDAAAGPATSLMALTSSPNPSTTGQVATFTATITAPGFTPTGTVTFREGSTVLGTGSLTAGVATFATGTLSAGSHVVTAEYSGDGYTTSATAQTTHVVTVPVPVVTAVEPPSGSVLGGTAVTVRGTGLSGATSVTFGGVPGTDLQVVSSTAVKVTAPAGTAGVVPVVVTTPGGVSAASADAQFAYTELVTQTPLRGVADWSVPAGAVRCQQVAGTNGVPAEATGVIVNVTTVHPTGPGYVVVYPDTAGNGATVPPNSSTVNFEPGADVANSAFVALPDNGKICYSTRGASNAGVLVDVTGYVLDGSGIVMQSARRLLDTRAGSIHVGQVTGPVASRRVYTVDVAGQAGVPATATAVLVNVTVADVSTVGNLRVYPAGQAIPGTSVLNYAPGKDKATATIVALGDDGAISFYSDTAGTAQVILDVVGYVEAGSAYTGIAPERIVDTRTAYQTGPLTGALTGRRVYSVPVAGTGPVPTDATAVVLNVTAIGPTSIGNLRVYPDTDGTGTTPPPTASSINYIPGRDIPNQVVVALPANGRVNFYSDTAGTIHLAVDIAGYITTPDAD